MFDHQFGPLVDKNGNNVPFAPLLRTREVLPYGMLRASWTLYQPHALVWDYSFWNGRINFGKECKLSASKVPNLSWELIVSPPFLRPWYKFLQVCESRSAKGRDMDAVVSPLLPVFHCQNYQTPFRILSEEEVAALSGLHEFWTRTSPEDAEHFPEHVVRNFCGNCFHPALISSALGKDETLRRWAASTEEGPTEAKTKLKKEAFHIDRTLPPFQAIEPGETVRGSSHSAIDAHSVLPPTIVGYRKVRVTKTERHIQHCVDAALHKLEERQCAALRSAGMERIFDGLRAACCIPFHFNDFATCIIGEEPSKLRLFAMRSPLQCPSLQAIGLLRTAFCEWEAHPCLCTVFSTLLAGAACNCDSSWPLGHVILLPGGGPNSVCYIGAAAPKLLLLVNVVRPQAPEVYVVEAIAYRRTIQLGRLPIVCQKSWPSKQLGPDSEFNIEYRDGQGVLNVGAYHCQQEGCLSCFLADCLQLAYCPWHPPTPCADVPNSQKVLHLFCAKNSGDSTVDLVGQLCDSPSAGAIHVFHVCTAEQIHQLGARLQPVQNKVSIFMSTLSEATVSDEHLDFLESPFQDVALPREIYRHLLVKAGGPASALDVWLRCRSQDR